MESHLTATLFSGPEQKLSQSFSSLKKTLKYDQICASRFDRINGIQLVNQQWISSSMQYNSCTRA